MLTLKMQESSVCVRKPHHIHHVVTKMILCTRYNPQLFAIMEIFAWLVGLLLLKAVSRSATAMLGEQSVTICGEMLMLVWLVYN